MADEISLEEACEILDRHVGEKVDYVVELEAFLEWDSDEAPILFAEGVLSRVDPRNAGYLGSGVFYAVGSATVRLDPPEEQPVRYMHTSVSGASDLAGHVQWVYGEGEDDLAPMCCVMWGRHTGGEESPPPA